MANIEASMFKGKNNWALMMDTDGLLQKAQVIISLLLKTEL